MTDAERTLMGLVRTGNIWHPPLPQEPVHRFPTGARQSPRHKIAAAKPHVPIKAPPPQCAYVPKTLNAWGNSTYGDCVSAEEAYAKACYGLDGQGNALTPEIFIPEATVISWARANGYLNGADLASVIESMEQSGFQVGSQLYNDGPYASVDWSNEAVLQSAISKGPVKIAIAAGVLGNGAGSRQGWYATGNQGGINSTDHCVSLGGYGPAGWLYQQLGVPLPSALSATTPGYLVYTWATLGFVDHEWIMGTVPEAWLRTPTTVGLPPLTPPPPPTPPSSSLTVVTGGLPVGSFPIGNPEVATVLVNAPVAAGTYPVGVPLPTKENRIKELVVELLDLVH